MADDIYAEIAKALGVSYEDMAEEYNAAFHTGGPVRSTEYRDMLVLEHHQREAVKFQDLWDAATLQGIINNIAWGVAINDPKYDLREWRYEMKMGRITKRAWRRLRGRVRAGKPIPVPPVLWIDFEAGPRVPMIDFAALYRKD